MLGYWLTLGTVSICLNTLWNIFSQIVFLYGRSYQGQRVSVLGCWCTPGTGPICLNGLRMSQTNERCNILIEICLMFNNHAFSCWFHLRQRVSVYWNGYTGSFSGSVGYVVSLFRTIVWNMLMLNSTASYVELYLIQGDPVLGYVCTLGTAAL